MNDWHKRLDTSVAKAFGRSHDPQAGPIWQRGDGCYLFDTLGTKVLDFRSGYSVAIFGHAHPKLQAAIARVLQSQPHLTQLPSTALIEAAESIKRHLGFPDSHKVLFNSGGARAVETALKIALTRQAGAIGKFRYSYHGRSISTFPLSDSRQLPVCSPGIDVIELLYPTGRSLAPCPASWQGSIEMIEHYCRNGGHPRLSAIIVEPALGARGYLKPPDVFFQQLRNLADRFGFLLIADEIQLGLGRGGGWLLSQTQGWRADLVVLGKSLGGAILPVSAVVADRQLSDLLPEGTESETFGGTPIACAIVSETLRLIDELQLIERASVLGSELRLRLQSIVAENALPVLVDGFGAVAAIEFFSGGDPSEASRAAQKVAADCLQAGLLLHTSGPSQNRLVLIPPLVAGEKEIDKACEAMQQALRGSHHAK